MVQPIDFNTIYTKAKTRSNVELTLKAAPCLLVYNML